jgi:pyrimidine operon attenuation protein/uracil phosphoribosyltransferase
MEPDDNVKAQLMTARDLGRTLDRMAQQIYEGIDPEAPAADSFALVGMQTRGVYLARRLAERLDEREGVDLPVGVLDVTMYRDDVRRRRAPEIRTTEIPFDITDRHLILVDDVVFTGRSGRAALDALMDMGRPASVRFLVIVDRGHRELPIAADIVGREVPTLPGEEVRVRVDEIDERDGVWLVETSRSTAAPPSER